MLRTWADVRGGMIILMDEDSSLSLVLILCLREFG